MSFPDIVGPLSTLAGVLSRDVENQEQKQREDEQIRERYRREDEEIRRREKEIRQQRAYELMTNAIGKVDDNTLQSLGAELPHAHMQLFTQINKQVRQRQKEAEAEQRVGPESKMPGELGNLLATIQAGGVPGASPQAREEAKGAAPLLTGMSQDVARGLGTQPELFGETFRRAGAISLERGQIAAGTTPEQLADTAKVAQARAYAREEENRVYYRNMTDQDREVMAKSASLAQAGAINGTANPILATQAVDSYLSSLPPSRRDRASKRLLAESAGIAAEDTRALNVAMKTRTLTGEQILFEALAEADDITTSGKDPATFASSMEPAKRGALRRYGFLVNDPAQAGRPVYTGYKISTQQLDRRSSLQVLDPLLDDWHRLARQITAEVSEKSRRRNRPIVGGFFGTETGQNLFRLMGLQTGSVAQYITIGQEILIKVARMDQDARLSDFDLVLWMGALPSLVDITATPDGRLSEQAEGRFRKVKQIIKLERDRWNPEAQAEARVLRSELENDPEVGRRKAFVEKWQAANPSPTQQRAGIQPEGTYSTKQLMGDLMLSEDRTPLGAPSGGDDLRQYLRDSDLNERERKIMEEIELGP